MPCSPIWTIIRQSSPTEPGPRVRSRAPGSGRCRPARTELCNRQRPRRCPDLVALSRPRGKRYPAGVFASNASLRSSSNSAPTHWPPMLHGYCAWSGPATPNPEPSLKPSRQPHRRGCSTRSPTKSYLSPAPRSTTLCAERVKRRAAREAGVRNGHPSLVGFNAATLWQGRLDELERLLRHRWFGTLPPGHRDAWLFTAGIGASYLTPPSRLRRELFHLARRVAYWPDSETRHPAAMCHPARRSRRSKRALRVVRTSRSIRVTA